MEKYLIKHSGIKGQRWGDRRYQYEDGTYTEEGKLRKRGYKPLQRDPQASENRKKMVKRAFELNVKGGKDKPNTSPAGKIASETGNISRNLGSIARRVPQKEEKKDLSNLTDEQLRKYISRAQLEQQYNNLSRDNKRNGFEITADILDTVGDVAAIGVSAAMIYGMIRQIRG